MKMTINIVIMTAGMIVMMRIMMIDWTIEDWENCNRFMMLSEQMSQDNDDDDY